MQARTSTTGKFCAGSYGVPVKYRLTLIFSIAALAFMIGTGDLIRPAISGITEQNPMSGSASGRVRDGLENHRAVDEDVPLLIDPNKSSILWLRAATMGGLCLVLFIVVLVAEVAASRTKKREQVLLRSQMIERRQAAEALAESNRLLHEARDLLKKTIDEQNIEQERLRAFGQMARSIAHDFDNALTPLIGFCSLLLDSRENWHDPEYLDAQLQIINAAAEDAAAVAARLKKFYRKDDEPNQLVQLGRKELVVQTVSFD